MRSIALLIAIALVGVPSLPAQEGPLDSLVREGLAANLGLMQQALRDQQSEAAVREARAGFLPSLDVDARYSKQSGQIDFGPLINPVYAALNELTGTDQFPTNLSFTLPLNQDMRLRGAVPLFNPRVIAGNSLARTLRGASQAQLGAQARALAAEIQLAWLRHATAAHSAELLRNTVPLLLENERVSERLVAAGTATPDNVSRARADRSSVEQRLAQAERIRDATARDLNQLLQRPLATPAPAIPDSALFRPLPVTLDDAIAHGLRVREEVRQADWGVQAAGAQVRLASAGFLPTVTLAADYGFQGNDLRFTSDNDFVIASVLLQWNLFRGGADVARRDQAQLGRKAAVAAQAEARQQVELDVRQAYDAAQVAEQEISVADARLAAAEHTFTLVRRRYEEGLAPHLDFTQARSDFTNAGLNQILTRYAYLARLVDLERAAALRPMP
jgi:outer membrane protein TolC